MSKVRIGFVGTGGMGQMAHLRNYSTLEECEVVAVSDLRRQTAEAVARRYAVPKVYSSHEEMLRAEKLDGLVASMWFTLHGSLMPELHRQVKYVFTEKPVALSVQTGEAIAKSAAKAGCTHMIGYHKRSDPATMYARALIDEWKQSGRMGPLKYVRLTMPSGDWIANGYIGLINAGDQPTGSGPTPEPPIPDMDEKTAGAYNDFVNFYIHQINLMRHLLGENYKVTYAEKSGVVLAVESISGIPGIIEMTPYETTIDWQETALVAFEKGYIKIKLSAPLTANRAGTVEVYSDPGEVATPQRISPTLPWIHAMRQQAMNFIEVCQGKRKPLCDAAEAVEDLKAAREYIKLRYGQ